MDISSSYAASGVVNIVKGATKSMVIDFGVLIEGQVMTASCISLPLARCLVNGCLSEISGIGEVLICRCAENAVTRLVRILWGHMSIC